jgi:hypothetical protein
MQLNKQALEEFKTLWQQDHPGEEISDDELFVIANRVLTAVELIYFNNGKNEKI